MRVDLLAHTLFLSASVDDLYGRGLAGHADELAEFAGRTCYLSYDRPNPATASNETYLAHILTQQHESVLEHASASFYVAGVSRNLLIELERHRFLSFSVVSTRYVDAGNLGFVAPPAVERFKDGDINTNWTVEDEFEASCESSLDAYNNLVVALEDRGLTRKQAREAAAACLPGGLETRFVVTGNLRAWRDVIRKRNHPAANAEIQVFARTVLVKLKELAPNSFQDFEVNDE